MAKLVKYEEITDRIEYEIAFHLNEVSKGEISSNSAKRIKAMYKIIGEMESLGDSGESISRILKRAQAQHVVNRMQGASRMAHYQPVDYECRMPCS